MKPAIQEILTPPYVLSVENIVHLVYAKSPLVTAAREEMRAAQHGLEEFRTNLSRLEPFVETRADVSDFPNRSGAFGHTAETVGGIQKETFEGAVLRAEAGGAFSRFEFDDLNNGGNEVEDGSGALVRARVEAPFFGSRRRQNRVIAQAFQESTARRAQLDYLEKYRDYVDNALSYYNLAVYYGELVSAYQGYVDDLDSLINDPRLKPEDQPRVESVKSTAESTRNQYSSSKREYVTILLAETGIYDNEPFEIATAPYRLSAYAVRASDPEDLEALIAKAKENNPKFQVLADAIEDTELQRAQAIHGRYDVTTFLEGTLFPLGSESFDDRLDGWTVGGGLALRLNDQRVLTATRLKAEAQIRQFKAEIQSEEIKMRRRIVTETRGLLDNDENRTVLLESRRQKATVYAQRLTEYFDRQINIDQLLDARSAVASTDSSLASNHYDSGNRERRLMGATGQIYEMVGLEVLTEE